jgi:hypothetical protein
VLLVTRSLFGEVRSYFALNDQLCVYLVIERNIDLALEFLTRLPGDAILDGQRAECHAHTRKGTPCQRTPLPGRDYCPSHKHLEEPLDGVVEDLTVLDESQTRAPTGAGAAA